MNIFGPPKIVEYLLNLIYSDQNILIYLNTELFVTHCTVLYCNVLYCTVKNHPPPHKKKKKKNALPQKKSPPPPPKKNKITPPPKKKITPPPKKKYHPHPKIITQLPKKITHTHHIKRKTRLYSQ